MKIYVCFLNHGYEGYSEPYCVFDEESLAKAWIAGVAASSGRKGECRELTVGVVDTN